MLDRQHADAVERAAVAGRSFVVNFVIRSHRVAPWEGITGRGYRVLGMEPSGGGTYGQVPPPLRGTAWLAGLPTPADHLEGHPLLRNQRDLQRRHREPCCREA